MNWESLISPISALVLAPLLPGVINRIKALLAGRQGQPLLQAYFDIAKLLRKGAVYSTSGTWVFRIATPVACAAVIAALSLLPVCGAGAPLHFAGDPLLLVYLLGLARFLTVVAALDTASSFEGMGASREVFFSALAEPVMLLCLMAMARSAQSLSLSGILDDPRHFGVVLSLLVGASLFIVLLAENARIPFDDPNTHLELTMIHEVMVLDHGGPDLALVNYGSALKMWIFATILVRLLLPVHAVNAWLDAGWTVAGLIVVAALAGVVESVMARLRLRRVPQLLMAAGALAILGLFFGNGVSV